MSSSAAQSTSWSAKQYVAFEDERSRPARDLLASLPQVEPRIVVDLGCGPGNSTELLAARFPNAAITGLDSSPDMVAAARRRLPDLRFDVADIDTWLQGRTGVDGPIDLILANAVLQWVPDHARLFPALIGRLSPGGCLAVQMPDNLDEPAHRLMREVADSGPWSGKLAKAGAARATLGTADWYYRLIRRTAHKADVWRTTYHHALADGAAGIVEWFKGSGLRPFLEALSDGERAEFLDQYQSAVGRVYAPLADGSALLPFPRLFIVAVA